MDLILVLLVVLRERERGKGEVSRKSRTSKGRGKGTHSLELVELDEHDGLLGIQMAAESLSDVRNESNHD